MAQGTVQFFEEALVYLGNGAVDLDAGGMRVALYDAAAGWAAGTTSPAYTATNEVSSGNGYTSTGESITVTYTEDAGIATFAITVDVVWTQNGSGPTNIYWGLIYDDNAASKEAIAFIDMGDLANISLQDGNITINAGDVFKQQL